LKSHQRFKPNRNTALTPMRNHVTQNNTGMQSAHAIIITIIVAIRFVSGGFGGIHTHWQFKGPGGS
jgi:hypothetical protein